MPIYEILSAQGDVENTISGTDDLVEALFPGRWRLVVEPALVQPSQLEIVITSITADDAHAAMTTVDLAKREVTSPVGATLTAAGELRSGGQLVPHSEMFRIPLRSRDGGRERIVLAVMEAGVIQFSVTLTESRVWLITQEQINAGMPPEMQLQFGDFTIFAVET